MSDERLLKLRDVEALVALKRTAIYEMARAGRFPAPVKLSSRCARWKQSDVQRWLRDLTAVRGEAS